MLIQPYDPVNALLDYILEVSAAICKARHDADRSETQRSEAQYALASDLDVYMLFEVGPPSSPQFHRSLRYCRRKFEFRRIYLLSFLV